MKRNWIQSPFVLSFLLALLFSSLFFFWGQPLFKTWEEDSLSKRLLQRERGSSSFHPDLLLVELNDQSIKMKKPLPWGPLEYAELIKKLRLSKAKWIVFESLLPQPVASKKEQEWNALSKKWNEIFPFKKEIQPVPKRSRRRSRGRKSPTVALWEKKIQTFQKELEKRKPTNPFQLLEDEIKKTPNIVLGYPVYSTQSDVPGELVETVKKRKEEWLASKKKKTKQGYAPYQMKTVELNSGVLIEEPAPLLFDFHPLSFWKSKVRYHGFSNLSFREQKRVMSMPLFARFEEKVFPSLALATWIAMNQGVQPKRIVNRQTYHSLEFPKGSLDLEKDGKLKVLYPHFRVPANQRILAGDLLTKNLEDRGVIHNKIVLVGYSSAPFGREIETSIGKNMGSLEVQASILSNLLYQKQLKRKDSFVLFEILLLFFLCLTSSLVLLWSRMMSRIVLFASLAFIWLVNDHWSIQQGLWIHLWFVSVASIVIMFFVYRLDGVFRFSLLKKMALSFTNKIPEKDFTQLSKNAFEIEHSGKNKDISVLSGLILPFGESLQSHSIPKKTIENASKWFMAYFPALKRFHAYSHLAESNQVLATFNVHKEDKEHLLHACEAALHIRFEWESYLPHLHQQGGVIPLCPLVVGTGNASVGNIGDAENFLYRPVGKVMDDAYLFQQIAKMYHCNILVTPDVVDSIASKNLFLFREVDWVQRKKNEKVTVLFELMGKQHEQALYPLLEMYQQGLAEYRNKQFLQARQIFEALLQQYPQDGPSLLMLKRCKEFVVKPPSFQWNGVTSLEF